ncbi:MAG: hypothetical protein J6X02_05700 [Bacilli bacterium]|nr:hypothetical protein [Bacilli bacterium]
MDNKQITAVDIEDIICYLDVGEKHYCAFVIEEDEGNVYFARVSYLDDVNCILTPVTDNEVGAVIKEYNKYIDLMESRIDLD